MMVIVHCVPLSGEMYALWSNIEQLQLCFSVSVFTSLYFLYITFHVKHPTRSVQFIFSSFFVCHLLDSPLCTSLNNLLRLTGVSSVSHERKFQNTDFQLIIVRTLDLSCCPLKGCCEPALSYYTQEKVAFKAGYTLTRYTDKMLHLLE